MSISTLDAQTRRLAGHVARPLIVGGVVGVAWNQLVPFANQQFGWSLPADWATSAGIGLGAALVVEGVLYALRDDGAYQGKLLEEHVREYKKVAKDLDEDDAKRLGKALRKAGVDDVLFSQAIAGVGKKAKKAKDDDDDTDSKKKPVAAGGGAGTSPAN